MSAESSSHSNAAPETSVFELIDAIEQGERIPDHVRTWLHRGFVRYAAGESTTLCSALRLRGPGRERLWRMTARERRDAALRRAYAQTTGTTEQERFRMLSEAIHSFATRTWPRVAELDEPPERLTAIQRELFEAFQASPRIPSSVKQLRRRL